MLRQFLDLLQHAITCSHSVPAAPFLPITPVCHQPARLHRALPRTVSSPGQDGRSAGSLDAHRLPAEPFRAFGVFPGAAISCAFVGPLSRLGKRVACQRSGVNFSMAFTSWKE